MEQDKIGEWIEEERRVMIEWNRINLPACPFSSQPGYSCPLVALVIESREWMLNGSRRLE